MSESTVDRNTAVSFAGVPLEQFRHVCVLFRNDAEEWQLLSSFVKDGINHNQKAIHIIDPAGRFDYVRHLQTAGVDVEDAETSGQLELRTWDTAYIRGGEFDQDAMLTLVDETISSARNEGFPLARIVGSAAWSLEDLPGVGDLVEYESRLNHLLSRGKDAVLCMYESSKFDGELVMDVLRTHPMAVIGGVLHMNPFYVEPDQFIRDLRTRTAQRSRR